MAVLLCGWLWLCAQDLGVGATPGPEKKRSRWDETPANVSAAGGFGATPAAGAGLPFGATPAFTPGMVAGEECNRAQGSQRKLHISKRQSLLSDDN